VSGGYDDDDEGGDAPPRSLLHDRDEAEEVVQEARLAIWQPPRRDPPHQLVQDQEDQGQGHDGGATPADHPEPEARAGGSGAVGSGNGDGGREGAERNAEA
jgi:hypothetical protein